MKITLKQADAVFSILIAETKHRDGTPFKNELLAHLKNPQGRYYFLSEDYYPHWISGDGSKEHPFTVKVESEKEEILTRTVRANIKLHKLILGQ